LAPPSKKRGCANFRRGVSFDHSVEEFIFDPKQKQEPQKHKENIMKIRILFSAIIATFISSAALHASDWNTGLSSGNWDYTTTGNWWYGNDPFQSGDTATFWNTTNVTITSSISASSVNFEAGSNVVITGGNLNLPGNGYGIFADSGVTGVISSYLNTASGLTGQTGLGTLELTGGGSFAGGYEQRAGNTLWLAAGTYSTSGFDALNYSGVPLTTIKFTIGSGVANGGASLNISGQLGGTTYGGSGINSMNLDLVSLGSLTGDVVLMSYGSVVGTAFNSVTLDGAALPGGYSINYAYGNSANEIALVVPEPSTWAMMLGGLGMLTMFRRRRA
jgi:hypothetical protein